MMVHVGVDLRVPLRLPLRLFLGVPLRVALGVPLGVSIRSITEGFLRRLLHSSGRDANWALLLLVPGPGTQGARK